MTLLLLCVTEERTKTPGIQPHESETEKKRDPVDDHFPFVAGEKSTGDEQMACAMLAIQLDNFLGGEPIQHRHVQGYETPEFMALFPRGVSYKVGLSRFICCVFFYCTNKRKEPGRSSMQWLVAPTGGRCRVGLQEVPDLRDRAQALSGQGEAQHPCQGGGPVLEQLQQGRLLHPGPRRGEGNTKPTKDHLLGVIPTWASVPQTIVSWSGSKANIFEKQKVREIASLIRDAERHGKARIIDTSEGEEPEEMLQVEKTPTRGNVWVVMDVFHVGIFVGTGAGTDARAAREHARGRQQSRHLQLCLAV